MSPGDREWTVVTGGGTGSMSQEDGVSGMMDSTGDAWWGWLHNRVNVL